MKFQISLEMIINDNNNYRKIKYFQFDVQSVSIKRLRSFLHWLVAIVDRSAAILCFLVSQIFTIEQLSPPENDIQP